MGVALILLSLVVVISIWRSHKRTEASREAALVERRRIRNELLRGS
jgi:cbb3-type cytochrome oxidase subunit 3